VKELKFHTMSMYTNNSNFHCYGYSITSRSLDAICSSLVKFWYLKYLQHTGGPHQFEISVLVFYLRNYIDEIIVRWVNFSLYSRYGKKLGSLREILAGFALHTSRTAKGSSFESFPLVEVWVSFSPTHLF